MTRVLAEILGINEPAFHLQLQRLERAAGCPSADIRLAVRIAQETRHKMRDLGLDGQDTSGPELYAALQTKLRSDELVVRSALGLDATSDATARTAAIARFATACTSDERVFAVKSSVMRRILKGLKPKATLKALGYRSMDSMLKHEPVAQLLAATLVAESPEWHSHRIAAYQKLSPRDFESHAVVYLHPEAKQWPKLAAHYVSEHKHSLMSVPELGAVVLLPVEHDVPALTITTTLLALTAANDMRTQSAYLKLNQVRPDFGNLFAEGVTKEPLTEADLAGEQLPWKVVHWFYGKGHAHDDTEAFEPHLQADDLSWHDAEDDLARLHPALAFWQGNHLLAMLDGKEAVSLNVLDVALGVCNGFGYAERTLQHMRTSLTRELFARYLHQENLQNLLVSKLTPQLEPEFDYE